MMRLESLRSPLSALLVLGALPLGLAAQLRWNPLGPAPIANGPYTGRVSAVAPSRQNPKLLYVGGADGGVWRSTDDGASWTPIGDALPTTSVGALAVDPKNDQVLYVGMGESNFANHSRYGLGLAKTSDGGKTWQVFGAREFAGRCFSRIEIDPSNPKILYATTTHAGGMPIRNGARGHPLARGPLGLFRSTDAGRSWQRIGKGLPDLSATDLALDPKNPKVLFVAVGHIFGDRRNGLYRSTDGGLNFVKLSRGLPSSGVGRVSVAVSPTKPSRVYANFVRAASATGGGASTLGFYRSDDGGTTWTRKSLGNFQASYGWYLSVVRVHPTRPDTVFVGGFTMRRSTDGGNSWRSVTPPHVDLHAIEFDASGRLLAGDDGGLHRSANLGSSWSALNKLGLIQFYAGISLHPKSAGVILGGTQDNGSNERSATGSWRHVFGGDGGCTAIDPSGSRRFVEYQGTGNLFRSVNGSFFRRSASGIFGRNCFLPAFAIDPSNASRMVYGTERVFLSTNAGSSWSAISGDLTQGGRAAIRGIEIAPSNGNYIYVSTNDGNVQATRDGGRSWRRVLTGVPGWPRTTRPFAVDPRDPKKVYFATGWFGVAQLRFSQDAGNTWRSLDGDLPDVPAHCVGLDARAPGAPLLYLGTDQGVWRSQDHGGHWERYGSGLPNTPVVDLRMDLPRGRIVVATQGRGIFWIPLIPKGQVDPRSLMPGGR